MFKKLLFTLLSLILLLSMCACQLSSESKTSRYKKNDDDPVVESESVENTENLPEPPEETQGPEEDKKPVSNEWKTAYLTALSDAKNYHLSYSLVHIDDDGIPELYLSGDCEATGDGIYTYKNGEVDELRLHRIGGGSYIEKSGELVNQNGHMGYYFTTVFELTDNGFIVVFDASQIEKYEINADGDYIFSYEYFIKETQVTEEEHTAAVNKAFDFAAAKNFYDNKVGYDEIVNQIVNY